MKHFIYVKYTSKGLTNRSKQVRRDAINLMREHGGYHYGGSFSCAEILIALYDHVLKMDDVFILSKGHGCWCYYVLLMEHGYHPLLEGHPHIDTHNGIWATTGSMGHGFPYGIGMALAKRTKQESGRVFVLMGDGECQEGTFWESKLLLGKLQLDNIKVLIDYNEIQGSNWVNEVLPLDDIFYDIQIDGHDIKDISHALEYTDAQIILAHTTKGKGVSFMQNSPEWHSKFLTDAEYKTAMEELE